MSAALAEFYDLGYHAATVRGIASRADVSLPTLYNHYVSKQSILMAICDTSMEDLYAASMSAIENAGYNLIDRLTALIAVHVDFHAHRQKESFVANTELRSLDAHNKSFLISKRDRQQRLFDELIIEAIESGQASVSDPRVASRALVTMCSAVAQWYRSDGPISGLDVARLYCEYSLQMLGILPSEAASSQIHEFITMSRVGI